MRCAALSPDAHPAHPSRDVREPFHTRATNTRRTTRIVFAWALPDLGVGFQRAQWTAAAKPICKRLKQGRQPQYLLESFANGFCRRRPLRSLKPDAEIRQ